ncbi:MAG TPA: tryptophan--tRNA ligase [Pyrinomonadaceae bacterium]|jgi:tryptophanyl-tRNA synthetase|nr:tryptophan--tRNA ligase [Pyrinomonadaceae bacterium]
MKKRILSGAQPTGELHLGNYLGALKNWVALQNDYESFYCIVNMHAITLPQDPKTLKQKTLDLARIYLASGIDPEVSTVFVQSDVSAHSELTWVLSCVARTGELERMTQFKDKSKGKGENVSVGLFTYPILMAADILLYQTDLVPVGHDQKQHLELSRDLAERFNRDFGETFKIPEPYIPPVGARIMSLGDPAKKMSKSDENPNGSITLQDDADVILKKFKRAVTDSGTDIKFDESRPAIYNLLTIYQLVTGKEKAEIETNFEGKGYGHLKTELAEAVIEFLKPFQEKMKHIDDAQLEKILKLGAEKAREVANATLDDVYKKVGFK